MAYLVPTASDLKDRYPAFDCVNADTITYWITDAQRYVDTSWTESDYAPGILAMAAHQMTLAGIGTDSALLTGVPGRRHQHEIRVALAQLHARGRECQS